MVGSTGTLMTMRLVRSKLRKREESSTVSPIAIEAQSTNFGLQSRSGSISNTCDQPHHDQQIFTSTAAAALTNHASSNYNNNHISSNNNRTEQEQVTFTRTSGVGVNTNSWVFPPKVPTPNIYNCLNNDGLLATNDKHGLKGLRKQFSGRFKRLVTKKPEPSTVIPPELKPQLKTIYVY